MIQTLVSAFKNKEIRRKILITLALLFIYRLACYIPIPGIDRGAFEGATGTDTGGMLWLLSSLSGGALANGALLAIGIGPYINASIIIQLLTVAIPKLDQWSKMGEEGKKKIANVTRVVTLILAIIQAVGVVLNFAFTDGIAMIFGPGTEHLMPLVAVIVGVVLVAGAMVTMWIGERITEHGIGNGISLLIFVGILSSAGLGVMATIGQAVMDAVLAWIIVGFFIMVLAVFLFIVFVDLSERRIPIQYAKQIKGRKQYGGQSTFIPIKINAAGVLPIIFANAIVTLPTMIFSLVPAVEHAGWNNFNAWWQNWMGINTPIYIAASAVLIFFFSFFYARIQFNPEEVAKNIQQYGGFIPGIRPGKQTKEYLSKVTVRITFWGALFLAFIALIPSILFATLLQNTAGNALLHGFTATGMLIIVSVALEFEKQLQSQLMMKQYKGFLK